MRYPVVDEEADTGVVKEVSGLERLRVRCDFYGRMGWQGRGRVRRASREEGVVHKGNMGESR